MYQSEIASLFQTFKRCVEVFKGTIKPEVDIIVKVLKCQIYNGILVGQRMHVERTSSLHMNYICSSES